jgi:hypothetical protein
MRLSRSSAARAEATALAFLIAVALAACGSGTPSTAVGTSGPTAAASPPGTLGPRPSSPAVVTIVEPQNGAQITGSSVHVVLTLTGATIVTQTTTNIRPDEGHIHLLVDNVVVSMNYGLEQDLPVHPGTYVLKAEFVAADHAPFNPRVYSAEVFFTVKG